MNRIQARALVTGAIMAASLPMQAVAGGAVCTVVDSIWIAGHNSAQTAMTTAVDQMAAAVAAQSAITNEQLISALRVSTQQRSVNAERETTARAATAEAAAQVYVEQQMAEQVREAYETYGPQGQAVGSCDVIAEIAAVNEAMTSQTERAQEILASGAIDAVPGSGTTPLQAAARRLAFDEPEAVSAIAFFDPGTSPAMRDAYMNNVIGLPAPMPESMESVDGQLTFMQARRVEAIRSPAIVALAAVRASTEESGHFDMDEAGGDHLSFMEAMDFLIARYGGGEEYEQYQASLVTKSETGIAKELARLEGIILMLQGQRDEMSDRRQAMIGALLAGEAVR